MKTVKEYYEEMLSQLSADQIESLPITKFDENGNLLWTESEEEFMARMEKDFR